MRFLRSWSEPCAWQLSPCVSQGYPACSLPPMPLSVKPSSLTYRWRSSEGALERETNCLSASSGHPCHDCRYKPVADNHGTTTKWSAGVLIGWTAGISVGYLSGVIGAVVTAAIVPSNVATILVVVFGVGMGGAVVGLTQRSRLHEQFSIGASADRCGNLQRLVAAQPALQAQK